MKNHTLIAIILVTAIFPGAKLVRAHHVKKQDSMMPMVSVDLMNANSMAAGNPDVTMGVVDSNGEFKSNGQ